MKKRLLSSLVILSFGLSPVLHAQEVPTPSSEMALEQIATESEVSEDVSSPSAAPLATDPVTEPESEPVGAQVSPDSHKREKAAKKSQWQNIALAVGAVVVATIALILVASNDGHKHH